MTLLLHHKGCISFILTVAIVVCLFFYSSSSFHRALVDFWTRDLPPLSGIARIAIYSGILLIAALSHYARPPLGDSPLQAPELWSYTLNEFFSLEGFMKQLGKGWINKQRLEAIRNIAVGAWICCILGFGGHYPPIIAGLLVILCHGIVQGCIGTSHRCGFARKLILVAGISTLFFGGITKLLNSGLAWMDGLSLAYYVSSEENGRSAILKNTFNRFRWFSFFLSVASVGLELGAIVALFSPFYRAIILFSAAGLHFGIWLTMWPNYFPQSFCYLFGLNWQEAYDLPEFAPQLYEFGSSITWASWIATFMCVFLVFVTLFRIEYWPVTGIPMYSFYRDHTYDYKFLRDAHQAQAVALEHVKSQYPNALAWSNLWIVLRLKNNDPKALALAEARKHERLQSGISSPLKARATSENRKTDSTESLFVNLKNRATDLTRPHGVLTKQWRRTLHNIAAVDMASKPLGAITDEEAKGLQPGVEFPGERWLKVNRDHLRSYSIDHSWRLPAWADATGELQLRCKLKDGYAILARVPWNPKMDKKHK